VIVVVPAARPVAIPAELIVATEGLEEFQITSDDRLCVAWLAKRPVALKDCVVPAAIEATDGVTVIDISGDADTVNVAVLLIALPAELLTTTANCELLSDTSVAGVV
jgi:hypothetical protein